MRNIRAEYSNRVLMPFEIVGEFASELADGVRSFLPDRESFYTFGRKVRKAGEKFVEKTRDIKFRYNLARGALVGFAAFNLANFAIGVAEAREAAYSMYGSVESVYLNKGDLNSATDDIVTVGVSVEGRGKTTYFEFNAIGGYPEYKNEFPQNSPEGLASIAKNIQVGDCVTAGGFGDTSDPYHLRGYEIKEVACYPESSGAVSFGPEFYLLAAFLALPGIHYLYKWGKKKLGRKS